VDTTDCSRLISALRRRALRGRVPPMLPHSALASEVMDIPLIGGWHITLIGSPWLICAFALSAIAVVVLVVRMVLAN
jgi:hypothetical protein